MKKQQEENESNRCPLAYGKEKKKNESTKMPQKEECRRRCQNSKMSVFLSLCTLLKLSDSKKLK